MADENTSADDKAQGDKIQGEGNYDAARRFDAEERAFIAKGEVDKKAREAADALDGPEAEVSHQFAEVERLCQEAGSTTIQIAEDDDQRALFWKGRKSAFAAVGRISPDYYVQDGVIPRTALPEVLRRITELASERGLRVANVFHAGDGNLHPLVLYDGEVSGQEQRAEELAAEILYTCLDHGGSITGEHGVGFDKKQYLPKQFSAEDLDTMQLVRCAFDPDGRANPGKVMPTPRLCGEVPGPYRRHPLELIGLGERF